MRALEFINRVGPGCRVLSIVGGGGKTSLLFALASDAGSAGLSALLTTTTRIYDPRDEHRAFDTLLLNEAWVVAGSSLPAAHDVRTDSPAGGFIAVLGSGVVAGKMVAIHPDLIDTCPGDWDMVLVEADGARHRPIKAPADHEPVIPHGSDMVCAVVGLDCLGAPLDDDHAFRPELLERVTGLKQGQRIEAGTIAALCAAPRGCFKGTPAGARRVLILNKADMVSIDSARIVAGAVISTGGVDAVAIATLGEYQSDSRIRDFYVADARDDGALLV